MAANYNRPKPIDPIWYRAGCFLRISCGCGRRVSVELGAFADESGVSRDLTVYRLIARLRCRECGGRPYAEVSRWRAGDSGRG